MVSEIADLLLATGLFSLPVASAMVFSMALGGPYHASILNKTVLKAIIGDYRNKKVVARGPLGLIKILAILAIILMAGGGLLQLLLVLF